MVITVDLSVKLKKKATKEEIISLWRNFQSEPQKLRLPSAPSKPIVYREEEDRPQPRLDLNEGKGMSVVLGRLREDPVLDWKFVVLSHNTVRGAAGAAVLNAELLVKKGFISTK
jgi:aspartate-semialdehyde dehydrogenase